MDCRLESCPHPMGSLTLISLKGYTQTGYYPDKENHQNQDRVLVKMAFDGSLLSVMDGHGPEGHTIAEFTSNLLPRVFDKHLQPQPGKPSNDVAKAFKASYDEIDSYISKNKRIPDTFSGTTAVSAWIDRGKVFVANTGDSRAVLGRVAKEGDVIQAFDLSMDQTPFRADERARIESHGGRIMTRGELHDEAA